MGYAADVIYMYTSCIFQVVATIYWLSRAVQQLPDYRGPHLDQSCFRATPTLCKVCSYHVRALGDNTDCCPNLCQLETP